MTKSNIWKIVEYIDSIYAECWLRSPVKLVETFPCDSCKIGGKYETPSPLIIEWEEGSNDIGDFSWPTSGRVVVKETVFKALNEIVGELSSGPVKMIQDPKLKPPIRKTKRKPRVYLPYQGPPLVELIVNKKVPLLHKTTTKIIDRCEICGRTQRELIGVEEKEHFWNASSKKLIKINKTRESEKGLFVSSSDIGSNAIFFRVDEFSDAILCTDEMKKILEEKEYTNIDFLAYGEVR
ncbi:hypothetical protein [Leptospira interrogans]|uniref:Uncharacterized protein n=1 Tax=Leptospira interrogans serogroup Icterohaemorrhagiae serovar Lai (strain 56601) TaxID=189518 RepID=Q8EYG4_LEPIN|nr:hypothetical protein [Leptospira interrogans]AAN51450.1 hypothetical protein LA_4252 [Leptospira interrogans serovar Lai str. 56601]AER04158.1 hypothetical protein LIF_A3393 [Leptospira interrogans serovar Lai str. IPAV]